MQKKYLIFLILLFIFAQHVSAADEFETAANLKASEILPSELLKGEHYRIDENVMNDGYINTYKIHSDFGIITAVSTPSLKMRIEEVQAIAAMKKIEETDTYTEAVEKAGESTLDGVKNFVSDPKESISGAVTGVGKMFRMAGEAIKSKPGAGEDSRLEGLIGFSNTKREYAQQFGVDAYSPNPVLQENLDKIAWAGYGGKMSITAVKALIPGGVGLALSVTGSTQLLNEVIAKTPPTELRRMNREKLEKMGIDSLLIDLFLENTHFPPAIRL